MERFELLVGTRVPLPGEVSGVDVSGVLDGLVALLGDQCRS
ncbi:hypothetical protein [Streptomyces cadmiisoli]|nr:hypothetical protein [Streptomyces cadmiisoli]